MRPRIVLLLALMLLPLGVSAASSTRWDFGTQQLGDWQTSANVSVQQAEGALLLQFPSDTAMRWDVNLTRSVQEVTITATASRTTSALFLWHVPGTPEEQLVQLPFFISPSDDLQPITIPLSSYPQWEGRTDTVGLAFPAGTTVALGSIDLVSYSLFERLGTWWSTFWTFDSFKLYSINFLWGPLFVSSPSAMDGLYDSLPPVGRSANSLFYVLLGLAGVLAIYRAWRGHWHSTKAASVFLIAVAIAWGLYDLRMTLELGSYAFTDYRQYAQAEPEDRTMRFTEETYPLAEKLKSELISREIHEYGVLSPDNFPLRMYLRYFAYPLVPVTDTQAMKNLPAIVVFHRPDVRVEGSRLVTADGIVLSGSGRIAERFGDNSYLFVSAQ